MFLGYNTNGFAHHRLEDAVEILAELGYGGIALTLDVHHLDPFAPDLPLQTASLARQLARHNMRCVIETGARFLLDARHKHQPTLISPTPEERAQRLEFLKRCVDIAADLGADCVSLWSGTAADFAPSGVQMVRLVDRLERIAEYAVERNIRLAFEPEPGMFIDTMDKFAELQSRLNHPSVGLTMDVGHLVCNGELPISKFLTDWQQVLWNVHIEDMTGGVHDHLMFGEGEVDFADVFSGLRAANYTGGVYVELSRHSYDAVNTARKAKTFLEAYVGERELVGG
jgi:sugar phosphate isomerase/epimerase